MNSLHQLLFGKTDKTLIQFFRYAIVGGIAFITDSIFLFIFTEFFRIYYIVSGALSFIIGLLVSYLLTKKWVFDKKKFDDVFWEFFIFAIIGLFGLAINELLLWIFTEKLHFYYLISKAFAAIFVYIWNFSARKLTLF